MMIVYVSAIFVLLAVASAAIRRWIVPKRLCWLYDDATRGVADAAPLVVVALMALILWAAFRAAYP